jgi:predicted PurR-regulated permease PerM
MTPSVVYRTVGLVALLVATALAAQQLMTLLLAVVVTIIVSLPLTAAADRAERRGLPRAVGAAAGLLGTAVVLAALGFAVIPAFISQVRQFAARMPTILAGVDRYIHGLVGRKTRSLSSQLSEFIQGYLHHPAGLAGPAEHVGLTLLGIAF